MASLPPPLMRSASGAQQVRLCSVQITGLAPGVTPEKLRASFNQRAGRFVVLDATKQRNKNAWCAFLNELTEEEADEFQRKWNKMTLPGTSNKVECQVNRSRDASAKNQNLNPKTPFQKPEKANVQILGLPPNSRAEDLASRLGQKAGQFTVLPEDKQRDKTSWCAYLNGLTIDEAREFQTRWNNQLIPGTETKLKCQVLSNRETEEPKVAKTSQQPNCSVKISGLPPNVSISFLKTIFRQRADQFVVPPESKQRNKNDWCAFINGLLDSEAQSFASQWDLYKIKDTQFVLHCKVKRPVKATPINLSNKPGPSSVSSTLLKQSERLGASVTSSMSSVCTTQSDLPKRRGTLCRHNITGTCKFGDDCQNIHFACPSDKDCDDDECCLGHSPGVKTEKEAQVEGEMRLCIFYRSGICKYDSQCQFKHIGCSEGEECEDFTCYFGHPLGWGSAFSDPNECSVDCDDLQCQKSHPIGRSRPCRFGDKCFNVECRFLHPVSRNICDVGDMCEEFDCTKLHSASRKKLCGQEAKCSDVHCELLHPISRQVCENKKTCSDFDCKKLHDHGRLKKCRSGSKCKLAFCPWLHPKNRAVCKLGEKCDQIDCSELHPPGRVKPCKFRERCWNQNCEGLHPEAWNPCPDGLGCRDVSCSCTHSPRRPVPCPQGSDCSDRECSRLHPEMSKVQHAFKPLRSSSLKSEHQRRIDREANQLPVLSCRDEFLQRLQKEKVLIVRAETGSGKTTQLPQYAAEYFGGLVICTQPRVMAAISIAQRVADEFDGCDVGESVGFKVGGDNSTLGTDIMFMTEACLIRYCQDNDSLNNVSVLIIDEAHERSLNVDIVLGLAKLIRNKRPDNFYVVIASATIDPRQFRDFFNCDVLEIPGRMHIVSLEYIPPTAEGNPDKFIISHLVPNLVRVLTTHTEGYALVFLPGEKEIQEAIKAFEQQRTEDNWVALPLYGSLPRDQQMKVLDFKPSQDSDRLIAFCTNVAETSLTINGVRLVVDSGLAKESRFDAKRRITVLELKQISQSAADQRKGRAGRTAPGHCVRLYAEETVRNAQFIPEILRSSLDLVILQLVKLKLRPLDFPFLDKPSEDMLVYSYQTLVDLDCLTRENSGRLSQVGELFAELGLDPRLSAFVARAHQRFDQLGLATTIACILTAPGSLFFLGRDKEKSAALQKRALEVFGYESDILYEVSVFDSWASSGKLVGGRCADCGKAARKFQDSCRSCRVGHSNANKLNNKVIEHIDKSRNSILKTIKKSRWFSECQVESNCEDAVFVVSSCLEQVLPEQVSCLLVRHLPSEGVKILTSDVRARISNTSVFAQRAQDCQYFIAMRVIQAVSGMYMVDCLHPVRDPKTISDRQSHPLQTLFTEQNVSANFFRLLKDEIFSNKSQLTEEQRKWIVLSHNADEASLHVFGKSTDKQKLQTVLKSLLIDRRRRLLKEETEVAIKEIYKVTLSGGLRVEKFIFVKSTRSENISLRPHQHESDDGECIGTSNGLTQLLLTAPFGTDESQIRSISESIDKIRHVNKNRRGRESKSFKILNLPAHWTEANVKELISLAEFGQASTMIHFYPPKQASIGSSSALVRVGGADQGDSLASLSKVVQSIEPFQIQLQRKSDGRPFTKTVSPEVKCYEEKVTQEKFDIKFRDSKSAISFFNKAREGSIPNFLAEWCASVYVSHSNLFPDLEDLIVRSFDATVTHAESKKPDGTLEIRLFGPDHDKTNLVANKLRGLFLPTTIRYFSSKERTLFFEIKNSGLFDRWMNELKLACEFKDDRSFRVFGPKVSQGTLMRNIADEFAKIESRYRLIPLDAATAQLFRRGLAGDSMLKDLQKKWDDKCFIKFLFHSSEIEIYARNDAQVISPCVKELTDLISKLGGKKKFGTKTCVLCNSETATESFFVCGHSFCRCVKSWLQSATATPICCPKCQTEISINEIKRLALDFEALVKQIVAQHVAQDKSMDIACCIVRGCDGFVKKNAYEQCSSCQHWVCADCKTVDDILHKDRDCAQFKSASTMVGRNSQLIKAAEVFVRQNWPADMPQICAIDPNPGLLSDPQCPAFKAFVCGLLSLGRGALSESDGFFAYHGSSAEALKQISHYGFDPKRRSGQACGPGEYFGVSPSISRGYTRNCGAMIVAFLLQGGPISHQPGFCYVVNNPTDGSKAFNLPVLVVYFDSTTPRIDFIKPSCVSSDRSDNDKWTSPFRWHWLKDNGSFEPYNDDINRLLETHYDAHKTRGGPSEITTPAIIRYVDDIPQQYIISYAVNTQKNSKTGYIRPIQRQQVHVASVTNTWEFRSESGIWQPFESLAQPRIQQAYQAYIQGAGSCRVAVQFPGRPETYELDFLLGQQKNLQSGTIRFIRKN